MTFVFIGRYNCESNKKHPNVCVRVIEWISVRLCVRLWNQKRGNSLRIGIVSECFCSVEMNGIKNAYLLVFLDRPHADIQANWKVKTCSELDEKCIWNVSNCRWSVLVGFSFVGLETDLQYAIAQCITVKWLNRNYSIFIISHCYKSKSFALVWLQVANYLERNTNTSKGYAIFTWFAIAYRLGRHARFISETLSDKSVEKHWMNNNYLNNQQQK